MKWIIAFIFIILSMVPAAAANELHGPIQAEVIRVVDGDTFDVRAQIWIGQYIETRVRLNGIDTPEIRGKCINEKRSAQNAKAKLESLILNKTVYLNDIHGGKYAGRVIANAKTVDGIDLSKTLIKSGYARHYDGKTRAGWC